jgi:hypothetical protein
VRCPFAVWKGAATTNYSVQRITPTMVVWHVTQGSNASGTIAWFHDPRAQVSSHFLIADDGQLFQNVDTNEEAYAEMAFNGVAISVETNGYSGTPFTQPQIHTAARLTRWIKERHGIAETWRPTPYGKGGHTSHGILGVAGGDHPDCPGEAREIDVRNILHDLTRPRRRLITFTR